MIKFSFDFQKWVLWLLPQILRQPKMIAYLQAIIAPIKILHTKFLSYRNITNDDAQTTGQVCILREYLIRRFDSISRQIYIADDLILPATYIYLESENRPLYLPQFIAQSGGADFVVHVPGYLMGQEARIRNAINKFKLPSKVYRLEFF